MDNLLIHSEMCVLCCVVFLSLSDCCGMNVWLGLLVVEIKLFSCVKIKLNL